jgi:hypothetical protein
MDAGRPLHLDEGRIKLRGDGLCMGKPKDDGRPCDLRLGFALTSRLDKGRKRQGAEAGAAVN